jgi:hypothetical protein
MSETRFTINGAGHAYPADNGQWVRAEDYDRTMLHLKMASDAEILVRSQRDANIRQVERLTAALRRIASFRREDFADAQQLADACVQEAAQEIDEEEDHG